jgi:hypothetical protein
MHFCCFLVALVSSPLPLSLSLFLFFSLFLSLFLSLSLSLSSFLFPYPSPLWNPHKGGAVPSLVRRRAWGPFGSHCGTREGGGELSSWGALGHRTRGAGGAPRHLGSAPAWCVSLQLPSREPSLGGPGSTRITSEPGRSHLARGRVSYPG